MGETVGQALERFEREWNEASRYLCRMVWALVLTILLMASALWGGLALRAPAPTAPAVMLR